MIGFYNYTVILTYLGAASGVIGIGLAAYGRVSMSVVCLMISGFCDLFDGTIAKTRKRDTLEKKFGIQIDSLSDLICFGILPVAIGFSVGLTRWYEAVVLACYALAALIRLAYYNVTEDVLQLTQNTHRTYYDGLPVTTAALLFPLMFTLRPVLRNSFPLVYMLWMALIAVAFLAKIKIKKLGMTGMIIAALLGLAVLVCLIIGWNYGV